MKPKFDMNRVCFAWNFSDWGAKFACVMYDVKKGNYIELIKTDSNFSLFRVEDVEYAFNKLIKKKKKKKISNKRKALAILARKFSAWKA